MTDLDGRGFFTQKNLKQEVFLRFSISSGYNSYRNFLGSFLLLIPNFSLEMMILKLRFLATSFWLGTLFKKQKNEAFQYYSLANAKGGVGSESLNSFKWLSKTRNDTCQESGPTLDMPFLHRRRRRLCRHKTCYWRWTLTLALYFLLREWSIGVAHKLPSLAIIGVCASLIVLCLLYGRQFTVVPL